VSLKAAFSLLIFMIWTVRRWGSARERGEDRESCRRGVRGNTTAVFSFVICEDAKKLLREAAALRAFECHRKEKLNRVASCSGKIRFFYW